MSPPSKAPAPMDPYFGRKDICVHIEKTVKSLFPKPSSRSTGKSSTFYSNSASSSQDTLVDERMDLEYHLPSMGEWLAYVLYRTALPDSTVFHALHLLRRVASTSSSSSRSSLSSPLFSTSQPLGHYALVVTSLLLATDYNMDDAYSTASWCVASKDLFLLKEMNEMQLDMLRCLGWRMRSEGEDLGAIIKEDEEEYLEELARVEEEEERRKEEEEKVQLKRAMSLGKRLGAFLNPHSHSSSSTSPSSSRSPSVSPERSMSRKEKRASKGFFERTKTQDLSLHRTVSNRA